jgi:hypothetical protein
MRILEIERLLCIVMDAFRATSKTKKIEQSLPELLLEDWRDEARLSRRIRSL